MPQPGFPRWIDWPARFAALETLWHFVNRPEVGAANPGVQAIELRYSLQKMSPAFLRENINTPPGATGTEFVESVLNDFDKLLSYTIPSKPIRIALDRFLGLLG